MSKLSNAWAVVGIAALSSTFTPANAQNTGEIRETINSRAVDLKCSTFFPNLPSDKNPAPSKIALIDSAIYHGGQMTGTKYALMSKNERKSYWTKPGAHPLNKPFFEMAARKYQTADDKVKALKELVAKVHDDFPVSRWDKLANRCAAELGYN